MKTEEITFGTWLRQQRRRLDFSRQALADQVGCAEITLRRIESGTLKPSKELTRILLDKLNIPKEEQEAWIHFARGLSGIPATLNESVSRVSKSNLPVFLTKFVGREREQAEIVELIGKYRLLTLTGPGGVGKTRLAGIIGEQVLDQYADGVWMVELASLNDPALIGQVIAGVFGISSQSKVDYVESLIHFLRTKNLLLILDNCEHLLEGCAALIDVLLKNCFHLKILVTGREPLQTTGEALYHVPSLDIPTKQLTYKEYLESEALQLFEERARLSRFNFSLTMENIPAVVQICRRLDGIPLAIELAAARVDTFSVEQIVAKLNESFDLLTGGGRTVLPRQRTIRGSMDWSWNLLSVQERILLSRLSIFSGGWTLSAAESVCCGTGIEPRQIAELISQLTARSLIVVNPDAGLERRYDLHEIVRQYAHEKIDRQDEEVVRTQHLRYYLEFSMLAGSALHRPAQADWHARLNVELDNIRFALDWASKTDIESGMHIVGTLEPHMDTREALRWTFIFLKDPKSRSYPQARAEALLAHTAALWYLQQFEAARVACEESLDLYRASGNRDGEFECLIELGFIYQFVEGMDEKMEFHTQALELARSLGDISKQAYVLSFLGWDRRHHQRSLKYWDEAIALYRQLGNWNYLAVVLGVYGDTLIANGELEAGHLLLEESLALSRQINHERSISVEFALIGKSREALIAGNYAEARSYLEELVEIQEKVGNRIGYLWARARLGYVLLLQGRLQDGFHILCQTSQDFHSGLNKIGLAFTLEKMAYFFRVSGLLQRSVQLIGWADKIREETGEVRPKLEQMDVDRDLAVCIERLGRGAVDHARNQGRDMTMDAIVSLALENISVKD